MREDFLNHLCMGCMQYLEQPDQPCPFCGWLNSQQQNLPHQLAAGSFLAGQYLVGRALGEGGFGITYLGWEIGRGQKVAIKEFYPSDYVSRQGDHYTIVPRTGQQGADQLFRQGRDKFFSEAQSLARFDSVPGIVKVFNYFQENDTAYIVMEFLEGQTLRDYLCGLGKPMLLSDVLALLAPVVDSLEQVHAANLIHRDISPDNIMITADGSTKLLDFGAARAFSLQGERSNTINVKMGYAPEEQYLTHGKQGPWTDVYALAATIYRAITGKVPAQALDRSRSDILERPSALGVPITPQQEAVLLKGMAINTDARYQSVGEFYRALRDGKAPGPGSGQRSGSGSGSGSGPAQTEDKKLLAAIGLCALSALMSVYMCLSELDGGFENLIGYSWPDMVSLACMILLVIELSALKRNGYTKYSFTVHRVLVVVHLVMCLFMFEWFSLGGDYQGFYGVFYLVSIPAVVLSWLTLKK